LPATERLLPLRLGTRPGALMREVLRSNDAVLLSFAEWALRQAGIASLVADQHISLIEGSIGAFPRRLLVAPEHWREACEVLAQAGLEAWLARDEDTRA
jgi:hypothetical protein